MKKSKIIQYLKVLQVDYCRMCELLSGKKDIDICFKCVSHRIFNDVLEELNGE